MSDPMPEFDDPALKAAIRVALADETAPASLRVRIAAAMDRQERRSTRRTVLYALAATLVFASGLAFFLVGHEQTAPRWFAQAMIATQQSAKLSPDHQLLENIPDTDLPALRTRYEQVLGYPALVAMLDDGWQFKAAGISQISGVPAAHLVFTRGSDVISIFSVKVGLLYQSSTTAGATYAQEEQGYKIAGFVAAGAVHCLVCESPSGDVSLRQLIRMRDRLRAMTPELAS